MKAILLVFVDQVLLLPVMVRRQSNYLTVYIDSTLESCISTSVSDVSDVSIVIHYTDCFELQIFDPSIELPGGY